MSDYDQDLRDLREKIARKAKVEVMLCDLRVQLEKLKDEARRLADIRMDEQADVDRLEKPGLASFYYAVLNQKEARLDKERAEAYAAAVKHTTAVRQVEAACDDIRSLEAELASLSNIEDRYNRVLEQKEAAIKRSNPTHAAEISRIEERLGTVLAQEKEIDEALAAGQAALERICAIEEDLDSAAGWGTWDLVGGGMISGLAKHSYLDNAQMKINDLQVQLSRYRTELSDVTIAADIQVQIDGFLRFADFFFDGLFADWAVLDSITNAQRQIAETRMQVENVQNRLGGMKNALGTEREELRARLNDIILKA